MTMGTLLIKGGHILDPSQNLDQVADILIEDGLIGAIDKDLSEASADTVVDVAGALVTPGLVDMHVHLREPGRDRKSVV